MIATVVRSIERNVLNAAAAANWSGPMIHLPYPGRWFRNKVTFLDKVTPMIEIRLSDRLFRQAWAETTTD